MLHWGVCAVGYGRYGRAGPPVVTASTAIVFYNASTQKFIRFFVWDASRGELTKTGFYFRDFPEFNKYMHQFPIVPLFGARQFMLPKMKRVQSGCISFAEVRILCNTRTQSGSIGMPSWL